MFVFVNTFLFDIEAVKLALKKHSPVALLPHGSYSAAENVDATRFFASPDLIVNALDPSESQNNAAGLLGFVLFAGWPFDSSDYTFLRRIVFTDDFNARGINTLRSLLL
ncbi:unnamed protein product [Agarophyton chilense]